MWEVEYTDEMGKWWGGLTEEEQEDIDARCGCWSATDQRSVARMLTRFGGRGTPT